MNEVTVSGERVIKGYIIDYSKIKSDFKQMLSDKLSDGERNGKDRMLMVEKVCGLIPSRKFL